ncbi:MAG TPA: hypothetical protein VGG75_18190 [Trebonia sp.]
MRLSPTSEPHSKPSTATPDLRTNLSQARALADVMATPAGRALEQVRYSARESPTFCRL